MEAFRRKVAASGSGGRVAGRVAIVTGAAQGVGEWIATDLTAKGAHVVLADLNLAGATAASARLNEQYGRERTIPCGVDVTDEQSVADMVHCTVRTFGGVDLLVSNAGVLKAGSVKALDARDFSFVTDVNYVGYFLCAKRVAPVMAAQHRFSPKLTCDI